jgi:hypothetical protein
MIVYEKKLKHEWHFVENKLEYAAHLPNVVNLLVVQIHKMKF